MAISRCCTKNHLKVNFVFGCERRPVRIVSKNRALHSLPTHAQEQILNRFTGKLFIILYLCGPSLIPNTRFEMLFRSLLIAGLILTHQVLSANDSLIYRSRFEERLLLKAASGEVDYLALYTAITKDSANFQQ
jgi:hypothetical protein